MIKKNKKPIIQQTFSVRIPTSKFKRLQAIAEGEKRSINKTVEIAIDALILASSK